MFHMLGPDHRRQEDREDEGRQREPGIGDAHDHLVDPAAEIAGENAQGGTDAAGDDRPHDADDQGDARPENQAAEDIAALEIGAEQRQRVGALDPERRLEDLGAGDGLGRVVRRDRIGEHREQNERHQDRQRQYRQLAGEPQPAPPQAKFARPRGAGEDRLVWFSDEGHVPPIWSAGCGGRYRRRGCRSSG